MDLTTLSIYEHVALLEESLAFNCGWTHEPSGNYTDEELTEFGAECDKYIMTSDIDPDIDDMMIEHDHIEFESNGFTETYFDVDGVVHLFSDAAQQWYIFQDYKPPVTENEFAYMTRDMSSEMRLALSYVVMHGGTSAPPPGINKSNFKKYLKRFAK